ncbi:hypothetical protein ACFQ48_12960 [Hymenobacter caeli]|uniref:Lipid-binding transport protein (Tim44 family) n=1 Tax=Hymenobacter caeli TaxID=2735894 RepID=A0ABX2FST4_9BACT|nr:hypothetical protein [Hymenobacter caeli]NRT20251.1 putative lipid-binding transport protein (Tim44 family) [Hymenobacter caeli]
METPCPSSAAHTPPAAGPAAAPATRPAPTAPGPPAGGFARGAGGLLLAVLAGLGLLAGALLLAAASPGGRPLLLGSALYLGYFFWARGTLKVETKVLTGIEADRDNARNGD